MMPNEKDKGCYGHKTFTFSTVEFDSDFESGNLGSAKEDSSQSQYLLEVAPDAYPYVADIQWTCWFYFKISVKEPGQAVTAIIKNMTNQV